MARQHRTGFVRPIPADAMESSSDDDEMVMAVCLAGSSIAQAAAVASSRPHTGSRPGRAANRDLNVSGASKLLDADFFCRLQDGTGTPAFSDQEFERVYRMPRSVYEQIREVVLEGDSFFKQNRDAANKEGGSTDLKIYAALQMLTEGRTALSLVRETRMSERQILKCMKRFTTCIVEQLEEEWIRLPTNAELLEIENRYKSLGFPGCIGAVDCASWQWEACPVGWQGIYKGKDKKPTMRLEIFCDDNLRVWSLNFGVPGSRNDVTIMDHSPFFRAVRNGQWPSVRPKVCIAGHQLKRFYFLVDGIYPRFSIFLLPLADARMAKEKRYTAQHSSARKAVERVFGVLFRQFRILYNPCRLRNLKDINKVMKTCVIIHNIIADARGYEGTMRFRNEMEADEQCAEMQLSRVMTHECRYDQSDMWREFLDGMENVEEYESLRAAIVDHIWNMAGEGE